MANDCTFSTHIEKTVAAGNKLVGWALRSFRRRSKHVMLSIWKTMVQPKLDYCSVLWSPVDQASISRLESVCRHFTSQIHGMADLDYWERLSQLGMYSQERRRERYMIIFRETCPRLQTRLCPEPQAWKTGCHSPSTYPPTSSS